MDEKLHAVLRRRVRFIASIAMRRLGFQNRACPNCGSRDSSIAGRKFVLMEVRRCSRCHLMFRWPKDSENFNLRFYQSRYRETAATELPDSQMVARARVKNFRNTSQDLNAKIGMLHELRPSPARVLDFGCSWGYGTFQLKSAGYDAIGFEISKPRAAFGRQMLQLDIIDEYAHLDSLPASGFDLVFTHHVLEHLPTPSGFFQRLPKLLKPGGSILIFVPNCGEGRGNLRTGWKPIVGEKHAMAFDTAFFRNAFQRLGFRAVVTTSPYSAEQISRGEVNDGGEELAIWATKLAD
jgi:2-polyprenyl-3-methyl-5-hydroxy-6-metoxy-1,4-benzoquinol methylase